MAEDSTRTKMLKEAPVDEDMGAIKRMVKSAAVKGSELLDRLGITQEKEYENKTKEELAVKKRKGGSIKSTGYRRVADGIVKRGKTRGRIV